MGSPEEGSWQPRNPEQHQQDQGNSKLKIIGGQVVPPLGVRKSSLLEQTSISKEISCQEGGTDRKQEALTPKMPPIRELAKRKPREGREGGPTRKCSQKMALAMEKWLQEDRKDDPAALRPKKSPERGNKSGNKEPGKERSKEI